MPNLYPTPCHREQDDLRGVLLPSLDGTTLALDEEQEQLRQTAGGFVIIRLSDDLPADAFDAPFVPTWVGIVCALGCLLFAAGAWSVLAHCFGIWWRLTGGPTP
jgi:hypothetical protein